MSNGKQIQMTFRDMLYVTRAVQPERARKLIGERLELDTLMDSSGKEIAFVSAVCFNVVEVRASALPLGNLSFGQINYRVYVRAGDVPAVCFLDMKVNSRTVATLTSFLGVPIHHENIEITCVADAPGSIRYKVGSSGLNVEVLTRLDESSSGAISSPSFITDRFVGYVRARDEMFRIEVEQPGLESHVACVLSARSPRLEQLGLLDSEETVLPYSALYVREVLFGANMPTRV